MQAYKFDTKISDEGIIRVPLEPSLYGKEVEIIIVPKITKNENAPSSAKEFIKRWAGIIENKSDDELNEAKYLYLKKKHQ